MNGGSIYPMVPVMKLSAVSRVGTRVKRFKTGDVAGVGCFVDSAGAAPAAKQDSAIL